MEKSVAIPAFAFPRSYAIWLLGRIGLQFCGIAILVGGIYIAERFIHIVELVVGESVSIFNVFFLLAWTAPEIHLALPIAILVAVYRVALKSREQREFVVVAASGQGASLFLWIAFAVGVISVAASLVISGVIYPRARFAFRSDAFFIRYEALQSGGRTGQFYFFPNYAVYVWPQNETGPEPSVFVRHELDGAAYRIINADRARLERLGNSGFLGLRLNGIMITELPDSFRPQGEASPPETASQSSAPCDNCGQRVRTMEATSFMQDLDANRMLRLDPRGASPTEWTTLELLGVLRPPADRTIGAGERAELATRFARALLSLLAPFMAWLTLIFTRRATQAFAVPIACAAVMGFDIAAATLAKALDPFGVAAISLLLAAGAAGLLLALAQQITARQSALIKPALL